MRAALCLAMMGALLYSQDECIHAARNALKLWGLDVVPSLFPYMVFCRMLSARLRLQRIPITVVSSLLGIMGGSPAGAAALSIEEYPMPRAQLLSLCALTGTMSPVFLYGTVGRWAQATKTPPLLLPLVHILSALLCALIVYLIAGRIPYMEKRTEYAYFKASKESGPISESADAIVTVGGCIVFYSVVSALVAEITWLPKQLTIFIHAILESAGGMYAIANAPYAENIRMGMLAAASGFSGFSILSQNHSFLGRLGIRFSDLVVIAILRAAVSVMLMSMACMVIQASNSWR